MNPAIYRQGDSRWGSLPYPTKAYSFAHNGCGCCSVTHCAIENPKYANYTPADVRKYMVQFATKGHGTLWDGITKGLQNYGYNVHWNKNDNMTTIFSVLAKSLKRGVILFGSTKGPDKTVWTTGGHYIAFVDYKIEGGKHWFYLKDSGGRHHDKWWCYEKSMKGDVRNVWICTSWKETPAPAPTPSKPAKGTYTGTIPAPTIKNGTKGDKVANLQRFLNWYHPSWKLGVDGEFGSHTDSALRGFQKAEGIGVDGIYGNNSYKHAKAYEYVAPKQTNTTTNNKPTTIPAKPTATLKSHRIEVDLTNQICTVYGIYSDGSKKGIMSEFVSTARKGKTTPTGNFKIQGASGGRKAKYRTAKMSGGKSYAEYLCRFHGAKCMHTVPYKKRQTTGHVNKTEFNKLGSVASAGCVRMPWKLAHYIYTNCPVGTPVIVFKGTKGKYPMGKPKKYTATSNIDPTYKK